MLLLWGPIKAPLKIKCAPPGGGGTSLREANRMRCCMGSHLPDWID